MAFIKQGTFNEGGPSLPTPLRPSGFSLSGISYTVNKNIVSALFLVIIPIPLFFKIQLHCDATDFQSLSSIVGAICALCFSIPIFLKEVDYHQSFWKQFFVCGLLALVATLLGILCFLTDVDGKELSVHWFSLLLIIAPVSISYLAT